MRQQGDDGVAETLAQRTQELPVLHVVAGVTSEPLLPPLLLLLHRLKVPEHTQMGVRWGRVGSGQLAADGTDVAAGGHLRQQVACIMCPQLAVWTPTERSGCMKSGSRRSATER